MKPFRLLAVTGRPVLHSLSPPMQNAALAALGLEGRYLRLAAPSAARALEAAWHLGLSGLNVTAPFKEDFFRLVEPASEAARETRAVNAVVFRGEKALGLNTDVPGVLDALRERGVRLRGLRALLLGAGGAAAAVALALRSAGAQVVVANRTAAKAQALARRFGCEAVELGGPDLPAAARGARLVVSTLSTPERVLAPRLLDEGAVIFDAYYASPSALVRDALARGCAVIDGREWLLYQGARALRAFVGRRPPVAAMRRALRAATSPGRAPNLALVGPMGAGKSTVGARLARELGFRLVDTDAEVVEAAGEPIARIFERRGEAHFRSLEGREVAQACRVRGRVIACGGGAVLAGANLRALRRGALVVWLAVRPEVAIRRLGQTRSRPMLRGDALARARLLTRQRRPRYAVAADLVVDAEGAGPAALAREIAEHWGSRPGR